jgi:hypothetical protein
MTCRDGRVLRRLHRMVESPHDVESARFLGLADPDLVLADPDLVLAKLGGVVLAELDDVMVDLPRRRGCRSRPPARCVEGSTGSTAEGRQAVRPVKARTAEKAMPARARRSSHEDPVPWGGRRAWTAARQANDFARGRRNGAAIPRQRSKSKFQDLVWRVSSENPRRGTFPGSAREASPA